MSAAIASPNASTSGRPPTDPGARWSRLRILVIVQATLAAISAIEAGVFGWLGAGPPLPFVLTAVGAAVTSWLAWRLRKPGVRVLRVVKRFQIGWLAFAAIDLLLSIFLARRGLSLAAMATRVALPIWIHGLARGEDGHALA